MSEGSAIVIHNGIVHNEYLFRSVLAEEIGHHFTIVSNKLPSKYMTHSDRVDLDKSESAALRWASDFLIPTDLLLDYLSNHVCANLFEVQDHFQVTDYLLMLKLRKMACKQLAYPLSKGRQLILSSLPSIYIYEPID